MKLVFLTLAGLLAVCAGADLRLLSASSTNPGEFPWIVSLQNATGKHFCAGAIVDETHIVTAAHCVFNKLVAGAFQVVAGAYDITKQEANQQRVDVSNVTVHQNYTSNGTAGPFDIAVLTLATPLSLGQFVGVLGLPTANQSSTGKNCVTPGWGNTLPITAIWNAPSPVLQQINSTVLPQLACTLSYPLFSKQLSTGICAKSVKKITFVPLPIPAGTCQGDSGGPMVCSNKDGSGYLAGIVSWGYVACGILSDVYTNVAQFTDFLNSVLIPTQTAA